jgi:hypothetical protein
MRFVSATMLLALLLHPSIAAAQSPQRTHRGLTVLYGFTEGKGNAFMTAAGRP